MSCIGFSAYLITNSATQLVYVGSTTQCIQHRLAEHIRSANAGSGSRLGEAIRKHGAATFTIQKVASARGRMWLSTVESDLIEQYATDDPKFGYNAQLGGASAVRHRPNHRTCICGPTPVIGYLIERIDHCDVIDRLIDDLHFETDYVGLYDSPTLYF